MFTKCHAQADEDSSDHVAMSVILQPVSLAVRMLRQVKSVGATAASLACHARTFLLSRLAPEIVSTRTNGANTQSRSHTRAKTETHAHVVNAATMALRPLEEHEACAGIREGLSLCEGVFGEKSWERAWHGKGLASGLCQRVTDVIECEATLATGARYAWEAMCSVELLVPLFRQHRGAVHHEDWFSWLRARPRTT